MAIAGQKDEKKLAEFFFMEPLTFCFQNSIFLIPRLTPSTYVVFCKLMNTIEQEREDLVPLYPPLPGESILYLGIQFIK